MRVRAAISPHGGDGKSRTAPHFLNCSERAQTFFFRCLHSSRLHVCGEPIVHARARPTLTPDKLRAA